MTASTDEDGSAGSPLAGLRVLDLTTFLSGPYATQVLADLGADVVKIEPPTGDSSRTIPPHFVDGDSAYFLSVNRNKRSVVLDLKSEDGKRDLHELADAADVVIENFRPGVLERLGLNYAELDRRNPGVVWGSISGFGQDGPYRDRPAYDMIVQALSGGMHLNGLPGGPAVRAGVPIGDLCAGMFAVIGILAALHRRTARGRGEWIDIAMLDCQISMLTYQGVYHLLAGVEPGRQGRGHDSIPTYRAFTAADGIDVLVAANTERMWVALCTVLDVPELVDDPAFATPELRHANRLALWQRLEAAFATRPAAAWLEGLHAEGVPASTVNTISQALADPQVQHRQMVLSERADARRPLRLLGNPIKLRRSGPRPLRPPPRLGEHTADVLSEWLGRPRSSVND